MDRDRYKFIFNLICDPDYSTKRIVKEAGISRRSLYEIFGELLRNREEILGCKRNYSMGRTSHKTPDEKIKKVESTVQNDMTKTVVQVCKENGVNQTTYYRIPAAQRPKRKRGPGHLNTSKSKPS